MCFAWLCVEISRFLRIQCIFWVLWLSLFLHKLSFLFIVHGLLSDHMAHWTLRGKHTVASAHLCTLNCFFNTSICCRPYLGVWISPVLIKQEGDYWSGLLWHNAKAALDTQSFLVNGLFTLCDHPICFEVSRCFTDICCDDTDLSADSSCILHSCTVFWQTSLI